MDELLDVPTNNFQVGPILIPEEEVKTLYWNQDNSSWDYKTTIPITDLTNSNNITKPLLFEDVPAAPDHLPADPLITGILYKKENSSGLWWQTSDGELDLTNLTAQNAVQADKLKYARTISGVPFDGTANISLTTSNITEGSRLYYTTARARSALSASDANANLTYNSTTGIISMKTSPTFETLVVNNDLYVSGTTTTVNTTNLIVADAFIKVADGNVLPGTDVGFYTSYRLNPADPLTTYYAGLYRDGTNNAWYLFDNLASPDPGPDQGFTPAPSNPAEYGILHLNTLYAEHITATNNISGSISGNAATATALATARTIAGVSFDGTANISLDTTHISEGTNLYYLDSRARSAISVSDAKSNLTYASLTGILTLTASPSFTGLTVSSTISGSISGNAATATALATARTIAGISFDGTANISLTTTNITEGTNLYYLDSRARSAISISDAKSNLTYVPLTGVLTLTASPSFTGLTVASTISGSITGNAATATALATARTIAGVSFDGTANISLSTTNISEGTNLYYTDSRARSAISISDAKSNLTYNAISGLLTLTDSPSFTGLTVASTISGSISGNAATATALATARTIAGVSFDGTANIALTTTNITEGTNLYYLDSRARSSISVSDAKSNLTYTSLTGVLTLTASPSFTGLTVASAISGSITGNAATATALATARTIAGVSFDGTANISLTTTNISEGTNLYYLDSRARSSLSIADANPNLTYNSTTGIFTLTATPSFTGLTVSGLTASSLVATTSGSVLTSSVSALSPTFTGLTLSGLSASSLVATTVGSTLTTSVSALSPTFTNLTLSTHSSIANRFLYVNGSGTLTSTAIGTSAQYWRGDLSLGTLNQAAVSGLTTADSPTFTNITITGLSASTLVATDINDQLTTSVSGLSPTFTGLTLSGLAPSSLLATTAGSALTTSVSTLSPTFTGLTLSGLTASTVLLSDTNKGLISATLGASLTLSANTLNTVQAITTTSTPQFSSLGLGTTAGTAGQLRLTSAIIMDNFIARDTSSNRLLYLSGTANHDIFIGRGTPASAGANQNVIIGYGAAPSNSGIRCVIIGSGGVGANKTTGNDCVLIGGQGCGQNITGPDNICIGRSMCINTTLTGQYNVCIGPNCARNMGGAASSNMAIGTNALENSTSGSNNVGIGTDAGKGAAAHTGTLSGNTFIGHWASRNYVRGTGLVCIGYESAVNMSGANNTIVGYQAGYANSGTGTTQNNHTMVGYQAGYSNIAGSSCVFIGYQAGYSETGSNKLYISNSNTATPLIGGDFSANTVTITGTLTTSSGIKPSSASTTLTQYIEGTSSVAYTYTGTVGGTISFAYVITGKQVTIRFAQMTFTTSSTQTLITVAAGQFIAALRPATATNVLICTLLNNQQTWGIMFIGTDGSATINFSGSTFPPSTANTGIMASTISYCLL